MFLFLIRVAYFLLLQQTVLPKPFSCVSSMRKNKETAQKPHDINISKLHPPHPNFCLIFSQECKLWGPKLSYALRYECTQDTANFMKTFLLFRKNNTMIKKNVLQFSWLFLKWAMNATVCLTGFIQGLKKICQYTCTAKIHIKKHIAII